MDEAYHFPRQHYLLVGKIAKAHGLHGEVKVQPFSDSRETLLQYKYVRLVDSNGELSPRLHIEKSRGQGKSIVFKIESIDDKSRADLLHGMGILIDKADLQELEDDEYYWYQYYSLPVSTDDGLYLGTVKSIFSNGAQDILVVDDTKSEYLIPILDDIIVEHSEKGIIVSPPSGLLEINSREVK